MNRPAGELRGDEPRDERRASARESTHALGLDRFSMFVPAVMSVGIVFWFLSELRDLFSSFRAREQDKRAYAAALRVAGRATGERHGDPGIRRTLRPRPVYLLLSVALIGTAVYVAVGSIANYRRSGGYVSDIGWLLALSLAVAAVALLYGAVALAAFVTYDNVDWRATRLLYASPLTVAPSSTDDSGARPSWKLTAAVVATTAAAVVLTAIEAWAPDVVRGFDRRGAEWLAGRPGAEILTWLDPVGRTHIAIAVAAIAAVLAMRCRVLVSGYVAALLAVLVTSALLPRLVGHPRPPAGPFGGRHEAFPSVHVLHSTVMAGMVPLVLAVVTGTRAVIRPLRLVLAVGVAAAALDRVGSKLHWPTDVVGGMVMGCALVLSVDWLLANGRSHDHCRSCPWSQAPQMARPHMTKVRLHAESVLRTAAHLSAGAAAVALTVVTLRGDLPTNPEGTPFGRAVETPAQMVLAALVSIGALIAWRWPGVGAVMLAFAATGLGIFASVEYEPRWAMTITAVLLLPAALTWLGWQHERPTREVAVVGAVTVALLATTWVGSTTMYDKYFGPTHPQSTTAPVPVHNVEWIWTGGLDHQGVTATARLAPGHRGAVLVARAGTQVVRSTVATPDAHRLVRMQVAGLASDTDYELRVETDGVLDEGRGVAHIHTPAAGPYSFRVAVASCARTGSNGSVFDEIRRLDPLLFLQIGDFHYRNLETTSPVPFVAAFDDILTRPAPAALARAVPMGYVWDDHDYGPNDADAASPSRAAARAAYRMAVPHYDLASGDGAINQAFTIGRVRFVMTDTRSERTEASMLGEAQLQWLIDEVVSASRTHALVVWVSTSPWIGPASPTADTWAGHADERRRIADAFAAADVHNLVMVTGDAHMVAIDDGTNSDYSTAHEGGFPVLAAAALDRPGNVKGGPYSLGTFPGSGQFGLIDVVDDGGPTVQVTLSGRTWRGETLVSSGPLRFAVPAAPAPSG